MRRLSLLLLVAIVAAGVSVAVVTAASRAGTGRSDVQGTHARDMTSNTTKVPMVKDVGVFPYYGSSTQWHALLRLAKSDGARIVSSNMSWSSLEPTSPKDGGWELDRDYLAYAKSLGLKVRIQLTGMPNWARPSGAPRVSQSPWLAPSTARELQLWSNFVTRVAKTFKGEIQYYEIWNEPNQPQFFKPYPNPTVYARLLEASYLAVKAVDPTAQVIFAGLAQNDIGYLQQAYAAIDRLYGTEARTDHHFFDILGAHPYNQWRSPLVNSATYDYQDNWGLMDGNYLGYQLLHKVMVSNGDGDKKIYITEYGFTLARISDTTRAAYLQDAFRLARSSGYIMAFAWYCLYPNAANSPDWSMLQGSYPHWHVTRTYSVWKSEPD